MEIETIINDVEFEISQSEQTGEGNKYDIEGEITKKQIPSRRNKQQQNDTNSQLVCGDKFYGTIRTNINKKQEKKTDNWTVESNDGKKMEVSNVKGEKFTTNPRTIEKLDTEEKMQELKEKQEKNKKKEEEKQEQLKKEQEFKEKAVDYKSLQPNVQLRTLIDCEMRNIWMVGPAGAGKSTITRNTAHSMELPYLCISCGIGTSAAEFVGYKYPTREATKFAEYYAKPSIILIDEITALDPAVAQVLNAALANDEIETTTGLVKRHKDCIIIATSNTFGNGASRQYVANNQLDASTIDRFVGATIEIDYSEEYESQYDKEVVTYVKQLRNCIKINSLRRVASTRMIQAGSKAKLHFIKDWKELLIANWTNSEKSILNQYLEDLKNNKDNILDLSKSFTFSSN